MAQANLPLKFWVEAFSTAVFLINRLPASAPHSQSPYERLFHRPPDYNSLRVFGCACFPHLVLYNTHKLLPKSTLCVFLGYDNAHKGYRCLNVSSGKLYISRNVTFDEESFPYNHSPHNTPSPCRRSSDFRPLLTSTIPPLAALPPPTVATAADNPGPLPSPPTSSPTADHSPAGDGPAAASCGTPASCQPMLSVSSPPASILATQPSLPCHPRAAPVPPSSRNLAASSPTPEPIISSSPPADHGSSSVPTSTSSPSSSPSSTPPRNPRCKSINVLMYGSSPQSLPEALTAHLH